MKYVSEVKAQANSKGRNLGKAGQCRTWPLKRVHICLAVWKDWVKVQRMMIAVFFPIVNNNNSKYSNNSTIHCMTCWNPRSQRVSTFHSHLVAVVQAGCTSSCWAPNGVWATLRTADCICSVHKMPNSSDLQSFSLGARRRCRWSKRKHKMMPRARKKTVLLGYAKINHSLSVAHEGRHQAKGFGDLSNLWQISWKRQ